MTGPDHDVRSEARELAKVVGIGALLTAMLLLGGVLAFVLLLFEAYVALAVLAGCALLAVVWLLPFPGGKYALKPRLAVSAVIVVAIIGIALADNPYLLGIGCPWYEFDGGRWGDRGSGRDSPREEEAEALHDCGTLDGLSRGEVQGMLGPTGSSRPDRISYDVGWVNDYLGPGDGRVLIVEFGGGGRVEATFFSPN